MKIRMSYRLTGEVQGVGFRFRARHAADLLGLTGWVRNEYDGSVSMEAQGERAALDTLLGMIDGGLYIRLDQVDARELPLNPEERTFEILD